MAGNNLKLISTIKYKMLKQGGAMKITVPRLYIDEYLSGETKVQFSMYVDKQGRLVAEPIRS